ncbi:Kiwa anti-phage protein KwaB-like domain-containing protein [Glutamicibacter ardleyensis]|uniref:Kiwa anti-phage protein KwaB-like domain-containing protein n=1 Tax=Glutamicibacter ardleyensis TaxID=225894 RepID=UPI003FD421AA
MDQIKISADVRSEIHQLAGVALDRLAGSSFPLLNETQILEDDECFVKALDPEWNEPNTNIAEPLELTRKEDESVASLLYAVSDAIRSTGRLSLEDVKNKNHTFYAVVAETKSDDKVVFIKRQRGFKVATKGRIFTRYADGLQKLEEPIFGLAYDFDLMIYQNILYVWNVDNYFALFSDVEELQKAVPAFIGEIIGRITISVAPSALAYLALSAAGSTRRAQQVRRISKSEWLHLITAKSLGEALKEVDASAHGIAIGDNNVCFDEKDVELFLNTVEQRIYRGKFDGMTRQSQAHKTI